MPIAVDVKSLTAERLARAQAGMTEAGLPAAGGDPSSRRGRRPGGLRHRPGGPHGYLTDVSRTYLCGGRAPTDEQRKAYRAAYRFVQESIPEFVAGRSFAELGEMLGKRIPEQYRQQRYPFIAHGCGAADEYPVVVVDDHHPGILEPGMVLSVEAYVGAVGGAAGAKYEEQIIITQGAPELISHAPVDDKLLA